MLPQAPEFDHFCDRVPSDGSTPAALWVPACAGVICSEGALKANWITASFAGNTKEEAHRIGLSQSAGRACRGVAGR
jgi:hypothetical protein